MRYKKKKRKKKKEKKKKLKNLVSLGGDPRVTRFDDGGALADLML
jgi:hypothetical protein